MVPGGAKVLVVDDSDQILFVLEEVLRSEGFEVQRANGAQEALVNLRTNPPDVIISDIMMPDVDGFRFHELVKQSSEWCDIPFLFLTALSDPEEIRFGKQLGVDEYVTKPFDPTDLTATVRGKVLLSKRRKENAGELQDRFRKRIIHTLSHEFRTPLVAINTGTELLLEQREHIDASKLDRLLESIQRGGLRLQRLVEDFMTLQQIDSGTAASIAQRLRRKVLLPKVFEVGLDYFHEALHGETINLEVIPMSDEMSDKFPPMVHVYDTQVVSVIQRLLQNAHKFGGREKPITVTLLSNPTHASILIRDRGPGMSDVAVRQACELFSQIDRDLYEQQGCGLGLPIATYYTQLNDGELVFRSPADGMGLEVEIRFPRVR